MYYSSKDVRKSETNKFPYSYQILRYTGCTIKIDTKNSVDSCYKGNNLLLSSTVRCLLLLTNVRFKNTKIPKNMSHLILDFKLLVYEIFDGVNLNGTPNILT